MTEYDQYGEKENYEHFEIQRQMMADLGPRE